MEQSNFNMHEILFSAKHRTTFILDIILRSSCMKILQFPQNILDTGYTVCLMCYITTKQLHFVSKGFKYYLSTQDHEMRFCTPD